MCGIIGYLNHFPRDDSAWLKRGIDSLWHRGPDDSGLWFSSDKSIGFGHRRLSILDLSDSASQPMIDKNNRSVLIFNGEIYNYLGLKRQLLNLGYKFDSTSDTEVILHGYNAWGVDLLNRMDGMFAFALYDFDRQILLIARDRVGEKPLYYSKNNSGIRFSSEIKGLLADNSFERKIDVEELDRFLTFGYTSRSGSLFLDIGKLTPASYLIYDRRTGGMESYKYWEPPTPLKELVGEREIIDEFDRLLEDSIKNRLVADVPVGVLLSGGLDSSLITAYAAKTKGRIKTFTAGFPNHGRFDERIHAKKISEYFGTDHYELEINEVTPELLEKLAIQFDDPIADSSIVPTYQISEMISKHCKVALGGDGADEIFGGYSHYAILANLKNKIGWIPFDTRKGVSNLFQNILPIGFKGRNFAQRISVDFQRDRVLGVPYFDQCNRKKLFNAVNGSFVREDTFYKNSNELTNNSILERAMNFDFEDYLPGDILTKIDRASMLASVEFRAPFLSKDLINFSFERLPCDQKVYGGEGKILLKKLGKKILPNSFDFVRKQGFSIPIDVWIRSPIMTEFVHETLLGNQTLFDRKYIRSLLSSLSKRRANSDRVFLLLMFELWRKAYVA